MNGLLLQQQAIYLCFFYLSTYLRHALSATQDEGVLSAAASKEAAGGSGGVRQMLKAYFAYFQACGYHILACLLLFTIGFQGLNVIQSLFLKDWLRAMSSSTAQSGSHVRNPSFYLSTFPSAADMKGVYLHVLSPFTHHHAGGCSDVQIHRRLCWFLDLPLFKGMDR